MRPGLHLDRVLRGSGTGCPRRIYSFIRRHSRKAVDRSRALARSLCRKGLARSLCRKALAHNLDCSAFARSRDPHHVRAHRLVQKPRGTDH
jgi:hypothetical protein